jgi:hypothetical protein
VELPGIEPASLPGVLPFDMQVHSVLAPIQSRSLPAVSFSSLDGVKRGHLPTRDSAGRSEQRDVLDADEHAVADAVVGEVGARAVSEDGPAHDVIRLPVSQDDSQVVYGCDSTGISKG